MICYVDMEHEVALQSAEKKAEHQAHCLDVRRRLEQAAGDACTVRRYEDLTPAWLTESEIRALVIGGNVTDWAAYDEAHLRRMYGIIQSADLPILGICGGLQLIAMAHEAPLGPVRRLGEGERDPDASFAPGYYKEWGFVPLRVLRPDPLFDGLGERPVFLAAHYWELKTVPPGFELLASSHACRIQAIRRVGTLVYGTQFHPEAYIDGRVGCCSWLVDLVYPAGYTQHQLDGRSLLVNFFRMIGIA